MLQETVQRIRGLSTFESVTICNEEHGFVAAEQLREIESLGKIILELDWRNAATAIALAAMSVEKDPLLLVLAADHYIENTGAFTNALQQAISSAEAGKLVTFGIVPTKPYVGYG